MNDISQPSDEYDSTLQTKTNNKLRRVDSLLYEYEILMICGCFIWIGYLNSEHWNHHFYHSHSNLFRVFIVLLRNQKSIHQKKIIIGNTKITCYHHHSCCRCRHYHRWLNESVQSAIEAKSNQPIRIVENLFCKIRLKICERTNSCFDKTSWKIVQEKGNKINNTRDKKIELVEPWTITQFHQ